MRIEPTAADVSSRPLEMKGKDRRVFLKTACRGDAELRLEVQRTLVDAEKTDAFLADDAGTKTNAAHFEAPHREQEGDQAAPCILRQRPGEGGFETLWMAEQTGPVSRPVALEVVKGVPVTELCDQGKSGPRRPLALRRATDPTTRSFQSAPTRSH